MYEYLLTFSTIVQVLVILTKECWDRIIYCDTYEGSPQLLKGGDMGTEY